MKKKYKKGHTDKCFECKSTNTGRSPTGDWCNDCGAAYPGLECNRCGRKEVKEYHLKLKPKRILCRINNLR